MSVFLDDALIERAKRNGDYDEEYDEERGGNDTAVIGREARFSFASFNERVNQLAGGLQSLGLNPGDRLSILANNHPDYLATHLACARIGVILHVLNVRLTPGEMAYAVNDASSSTIFVDEPFTSDHALSTLLDQTPGIRQVISMRAPGERCTGTLDSVVSAGHAVRSIERKVTDPVILIYTSGTTGRPKGALQNHRGSIMADQLMTRAGQFHPNDVWLASMPFFHQAGLIRSRAMLAVGAQNVILGRLTPEAVADAVREYEVTVAMLVGGQLRSVLRSNPDGSSLRLLIGGGGAGDRGVAALTRHCEQLHCSAIGVYGQTETHGTITAVDLQSAQENPDTCGYPGEGVSLRIIDDDGRVLSAGETGEIQVSGDMTGRYWNNDQANVDLYSPDGWLHTGDLGYLNEEGWLHLRGRKKELIKTGAENVYPREVEVILVEHPDIRDAAVIGLPDREWGEAVVAVLVASGEVKPALEDVREFCRGQIAGYKIPRRVEWHDELPRNHTGKIQTGLLRERYRVD